MKKIAFALLLVFFIFNLCACGSLSNKQAFVGVWEWEDKDTLETITITINDDETGTFYSENGSKFTFTWEVKGENSIEIDLGDDKTIARINRNVTPLELTWGMYPDPFIKSN